MSKPEDTAKLAIRPRPTVAVTLSIPVETLESLQRIATRRDMSPEALIKLYVGQGLRQDMSRLFSNRIMETTAEVLARYIPSEEERSAILREIQGKAPD